MPWAHASYRKISSHAASSSQRLECFDLLIINKRCHPISSEKRGDLKAKPAQIRYGVLHPGLQQQNNPKPSKRLTSTGRPRWRAKPPQDLQGAHNCCPLRGAVTEPQTDGALNPQAGRPGLHTAWADYPPGGPSRRTIAQSAAGPSLSRAICKGRSACLGFSQQHKQLPAHL